MTPPAVVHVAGEHSDLAHTGGLGEVVAGLSREQARQGAEVTVVLPGYAQAVARLPPDPVDLGEVPVAMPWGTLRFRVLGAEHDGVALRLLAEPALFDRPGLYGPAGGAYSDNGVRFAAFSRAAAAWIRRAVPDAVLHAHDWHAGLAVATARTWERRPRTVMTLHNLAFQGRMPASAWPVLGLPPSLAGFDGVMHMGEISLLKAGLQLSDWLTTVSPTYARELLSDDGGWDLAGLFRHRAAALVGIVNGVDVGPAPDAAGRPERRASLCDAVGIASPTGPLFAAVSRLTAQKGIDLLVEALPAILEDTPAGAVILGSGEPGLVAALRRLAGDYPGRVAFVETFDPALAARIFAAADVLCVPSRFEPCGMSQLHAMHAGCVPLVRATGGLVDTVRDISEEGGWGLSFVTPSAEALRAAMRRAAAAFGDAEGWAGIAGRAQARRVDWEPSAARYLELYRSAPPHG